jgi:hypothetical protein
MPFNILFMQVQRFLEENDETSKLRQRQALVDLQGFSLAQESSLQGVFGVRQAAATSHCTSCCRGFFAAYCDVHTVVVVFGLTLYALL